MAIYIYIFVYIVDGTQLVARMYEDDIETMMDDNLQIIFQIRESDI